MTSDRTLVLVVEDEPLIRMFAVSIFEDANFSTAEASTADQALALLESNDVSLMFTDINMPGSMDGLELARTVCDRWPSVRIIVTSGLVSPRVGQLPAKARFVPKPYSRQDIAAIVSEINSWGLVTRT